MITLLPGTTVELNIKNGAADFLGPLFYANGLVLSQVLQLTGLSTHTVQNWVKRKFVSPPVNKKYDQDQFCTIVIINMLHNIFQLEQITSMIDYVQEVHPKAPSLIYITFVDALALMPEDAIGKATQVDEILAVVLKPRELDEEVMKRLREVLRIMVLAHLSSQIKEEAELMLKAIEM